MALACTYWGQLKETFNIADDRKSTLQVIHADTVNKEVNSQERNVVLDDCPNPINNSEKDLNQEGTRDPRPIRIRIL